MMNRLKPLLRPIRDIVYRILYRGTGRWCPVCEKSSRRFLKFGIVPRPEVMCVQCGALERHRLVWLFLTRKTDLFARPGAAFLHIAPERSLEPRLRARLGAGYLTADLDPARADVGMDITDIQYPDGSFDVVYCSHVLEHVPDDRRAMREFQRVLKPNGFAILMVPITADATDEDPSVTDPKERLRRFGQDDHVRRYGPDFVDRLREAGFTVRVVRVADVVTPDEALLMRVTPAGGDVYYCTKQ